MKKTIADQLEKFTGMKVRKITIFAAKRIGLAEFQGDQQLAEEQGARLMKEKPMIRDHFETKINIERIRPFAQKGSGKRQREKSRESGRDGQRTR